MKLADEIKENLTMDQAEAGDTSTDHNHWHKTEIDVDGNGKTIQTLPLGFPDHKHEISNWEAKPAGDESHEHKVIA